MDDPLLVGRFECLRDLPRDWQRLVDGNRPVHDAIGERRSLDQLQHDRLEVVRFFKAVNRTDVRMVERGEQLRFAFEASKPIGIEDEGLGQDFQRDAAVQRGVAGAIDLSHPACANGREDFVRAEADAGSERHSGRRGL